MFAFRNIVLLFLCFYEIVAYVAEMHRALPERHKTTSTSSFRAEI